MITRHCSGGIVFYANKVFIVKNDRGEWTLPKGKIKEYETRYDCAKNRIKEEVGIDVNVLEASGDTMYEFYSRSRKQQVCNAITWYIMEANKQEYNLNDEFTEGGFYKVKDAVGLLTHNKEVSLVEISYRKYKDLKKGYYEASVTSASE